MSAGGSSRRVLVMLLLAAVAGAVVWVVAGGRAGRDVGDARASSRRASRAADGLAASPTTRTGIAVTPYGGEVAVTEMVDGFAVLPCPADGAAVIVVMKHGGAPVANALLSVLDVGRADAATLMRLRHGEDTDDDFAATAVRYRADAEGAARIPPAVGITTLRATAPGFAGWATVHPGQTPPYRVALVAETVVQVRVVDAAGVPQAGVPVALLHRYDSTDIVVARARTADTGLARFSDVGHASCIDDGVENAIGDPPLIVALEVVVAQPVELALDRARLPLEPVTLVAPPMGTLAVDLRADPPESLRPLYDVVVRDMDSTPRYPPLPAVDGQRSYRLPARATARGGVPAVFPVGLGLGFVVEVSVPGGAPRWVTSVDGPESAGVGVGVPLDVTEYRVALTGRILGVDGTPLARQIVRVFGPNRPEGVPLIATTGGDGRVALGCEAPEPGEAAVSLAVQLVDGGGAVVAIGTSTAMVRAPQGDTDVGDIALAAAPLLAAGVVVDEAGSPIAGAHVDVESHRSQIDAETGNALPPTWCSVSAQVPRQTTDALGRFAIRGTAALAELRLCVVARGYCADPAPVVRGASAVRVVAVRTGGVAGAVVFGPRRPSDSCVFDVDVAVAGRPAGLTDNEASDLRWLGGDWLDSSGRFRCGRLRPGLATVTIGLRGDTEPLVRIERVEVKAGEVTRDPRLQAIDLSACVHTFGITCAGSRGEVIDRAFVGVAPAGAADVIPANRLANMAGVVVITTRESPVDVRLHAPGFDDVVLRGVTGDQAVTLHQPTPVEFAVATGVEAPKDRMLWATLTPLAAAGRVRPEGDQPLTASFGEGGAALVLVSPPGRYSVLWRVSGSEPVSIGTPTIIDVVETPLAADGNPAPLRFMAAFTAAELAAAVAAAK